jgi:hypothetical protein
MTRSSLPLLLCALAVACGDPEPAPCGEIRGTATLEVYRRASSEGVMPAHGNAVLAPAEEVTALACGETLASTDGRYTVPIRGDVVHLRVHCVGEVGTTVDLVRHASDPGPWRVSCPGETVAAPHVASVFVGPDQACWVQAHIGGRSSDRLGVGAATFEMRMAIPTDRPREALVVHTCTASGAPFLMERVVRPGNGDWSMSVEHARAVPMTRVASLGEATPGRTFVRFTAAGTRVVLPTTEAGEVYDLPATLAHPDDAMLSLTNTSTLSWMSWGRTLDPIAQPTHATWQRGSLALTREYLDVGDPDADRVVVEGRSREGQWVLDISRAAFGVVDLSTLPDAARPTSAIAQYYRQQSGAPDAFDRLTARGFSTEGLGDTVRIVSWAEVVPL